MIKVNNRNQDYYENMTINDLLKRNRFTYVAIIIKINGSLIEEDMYDTIISDGDDIKVIHICHGG